MTLRLHWSPDSANIVVRLALEELGLPYEGLRVDRGRGGLREPGYLALNPQGLLPVLEDGELVLFETGAILLHLADRAGRLGPGGPEAHAPAPRATFLKWLFYLSNTLHADLRAAFYSHRYIDEEAMPALRAGLARRVTGHLTLLEAQLSPEGWLAAGSPTLVDLYLAVCLRWARLYPSGAALLRGLDGVPRLGAMLAALEARPAVMRAFAAERIHGQPLTAPGPPDLPADAVTG